MTLGETELTPTAVLAAVTGCPEAEVSRQPVRCKMTPVVWGSPLAASLPGLVVFTFTADVGRSRGPDDKIYVRSPWMRQHVPRGFSVVVARQERGTCDVVTVMQVTPQKTFPLHQGPCASTAKAPHVLLFYRIRTLFTWGWRGDPKASL